jgi:hypothetical protein
MNNPTPLVIPSPVAQKPSFGTPIAKDAQNAPAGIFEALEPTRNKITHRRVKALAYQDPSGDQMAEQDPMLTRLLQLPLGPSSQENQSSSTKPGTSA